MTVKEVIEEVKKLPPDEAEEVMTVLHKAGISPRFDFGVSDDVLKDAIREARQTPRSPFTSEDFQGLKDRIASRRTHQSS